MSEQYELMCNWNTRWNSSTSSFKLNVPVAYCPNPEETDPEYRERYVTTAWGVAFMSGDAVPVAMVRTADYGVRGQVRLDQLEVLEDVVTKISKMAKVDGDEAIQHNPECPDCYVEMNWDEGFDCPVCHTHFDSNGQFSHKVCVEYDCTEWGELVGDDGQQRCTTCTTLILADEQSPFGPYDCKRCKKNVVGIPARSQAAKNRYCGGCQVAEDHRSFMDDLLTRRY